MTFTVYEVEGQDAADALFEYLAKMIADTDRKVVNVDLDGVVYPFTEVMRGEFAWRGWDEAEEWPDPTSWNFHDTWPVSREDVVEVMHAGIMDNSVFRAGRAMEGAAAGMAALRALGYTVRIVTAKTFDDVEVTRRARISTLRWLDDQEIPYDEIVFCGHDKTDYLADVVIDDKPQVEGWAQPNALNLLFAQEWNRMADASKTPCGYHVAKGWRDVINQIILWEDLA